MRSGSSAERMALLPGLVDTHVHLNEPGRGEWEGFRTGTRAAAAGGYTTLVDMPLNCLPETTTVAALEAKRVSVRSESVRWIGRPGVGWCGADNQDHLRGVLAAGGGARVQVLPDLSGVRGVHDGGPGATGGGAAGDCARRVAAAGACGAFFLDPIALATEGLREPTGRSTRRI